ncbi:FKBP-type peptidyl-prolyl cis-trans isomerase [Deminuibacter soli]|uniref:Peptidyl-prolyl cis-trans isomerase n=1 Tax=Deminuibacter soli TaxID=2291815 RepID=A0A3E1NJN9_9BACT|nr:FKBP-type peptidyl-prolyl cis-trans isomerase [Deminuibacter soli]RFM28153.1 hypothetical protein DXN05_11545 [Deminuibacter soli]
MRLLLTATAVAWLFASCLKSNDKTCQPVSPAAEAPQLAAFCQRNNISYKVDAASGIYYQIIDPGAGDSILPSSYISVTYEGMLLNNTVFVQESNTYMLSDFIPGWQTGIPWVRKNGHIKLVIPSSLAYACFPNSKLIPENAPLFFDITINNVR